MVEALLLVALGVEALQSVVLLLVLFSEEFAHL
jgi:hypothetical protein